MFGKAIGLLLLEALIKIAISVVLIIAVILLIVVLFKRVLKLAKKTKKIGLKETRRQWGWH